MASSSEIGTAASPHLTNIILVFTGLGIHRNSTSASLLKANAVADLPSHVASIAPTNTALVARLSLDGDPATTIRRIISFYDSLHIHCGKFRRVRKQRTAPHMSRDGERVLRTERLVPQSELPANVNDACSLKHLHSIHSAHSTA